MYDSFSMCAIIFINFFAELDILVDQTLGSVALMEHSKNPLTDS
jgi:hypothetical protein